jgi:ethanolamine utilization protein EutA
VLQPPLEFGDEIDAEAVAAAIRQHRRLFDAMHADAEIALAFHWRGVPAYDRLYAFARGIALGIEDRIAAGRPLHIMLDGDVAQTLGAILREDVKVKNEILVIDGVMLSDFDYIDLGRLRLPSYTVPVTIKSLIFRDEMHASSGKEWVHSHHGGDHDHDQGHGHHHHHGHGE